MVRLTRKFTAQLHWELSVLASPVIICWLSSLWRNTLKMSMNNASFVAEQANVTENYKGKNIFSQRVKGKYDEKNSSPGRPSEIQQYFYCLSFPSRIAQNVRSSSGFWHFFVVRPSHSSFISITTKIRTGINFAIRQYSQLLLAPVCRQGTKSNTIWKAEEAATEDLGVATRSHKTRLVTVGDLALRTATRQSRAKRFEIVQEAADRDNGASMATSLPRSETSGSVSAHGRTTKIRTERKENVGRLLGAVRIRLRNIGGASDPPQTVYL